MASALLDLTTIAAAASEREALVQLDDVLQRPRDGAVVMVIDGEKVEVPPAVLQLLGECVRALVHNRAVTLLPRPRQLTTQEAADLLNVSRPYLVRLLDQGTIPHTKTGTHRRVRFTDVLAYRARRDRERRKHMRRLSQLGQEIDTAAAE